MGQSSSISAWNFVPKKRITVLFLGMGGSGKTTVLYSDFGITIPTIGFNIEEINYRGCVLKIFDVGGGDRIYPLWVHYLEDKPAIVFFIDSSEETQLAQAKERLHMLLNQEKAKGLPLIIAANMKDVDQSMSNEIMEEYFNLHTLTNRKWKVIGLSGKNCDGVYEIYDWVLENM